MHTHKHPHPPTHTHGHKHLLITTSYHITLRQTKDLCRKASLRTRQTNCPDKRRPNQGQSALLVSVWEVHIGGTINLPTFTQGKFAYHPPPPPPPPSLSRTLAFVSVCLSLSVFLSVCLCLPVCLSVCLCLPVCLSVCLSVSVCLSLSVFLCLSVYLSFSLSLPLFLSNSGMYVSQLSPQFFFSLSLPPLTPHPLSIPLSVCLSSQ